MKKLVFILFLNLFGTYLCSQQIQFSRNYPFQTGSNYSGGVVQNLDSGYVFLSNILQAGFRGFTFTDTDKNGDTTFTKEYQFPNYSFSLGGTHSLIITADGNYLQCGSGIDTSNNRQGYLIKFDALGDTLWMKNYGGPDSDVLYSIYEDGNGILWACGSTSNTTNGFSDFWLITFDLNGNVLSDTTYGSSGSDAVVCGDFTFDGGFVLSGLSGSLPYVIKINSAGAVQWAHVYPGYSGYGFITQLPDSHFVLACNKITAQEDYGALVNLDTGGIVNWYALVGFPTYSEALYTKPILCSDGIAIAGISSPYSSAPQGYLTKTDFNGNMLWQRVYTLNSLNSHYIYDFRSTNDNGFILSGSCFITDQDSWLIKVDSLGCEVTGCDGVGFVDQPEENEVSVYPNPTGTDLNFSFSEERERRIVLFDSFGRIILEEQTSDSQYTINVESFAEGIYFYTIIEDGEVKSSAKFVVAH